MLTSYIKERLSRPILSEAGENKPPSDTRRHSVLEKLKTYKSGELFLDDEDDSDSDIPDPFEDLKNRTNMDKSLFKKTMKNLVQLENNTQLMSSFSEDIPDPFEDINIPTKMDKLFKKTKKKLTQLESNMKLMSMFSDDFKRAMDETRAELEIKASNTFYEDMNQITETLRESRLMRNLPKCLEEEDVLNYSELNCDPDLDIHTPRKSSICDENEEVPEKEIQDKEENEKETNAGNNESVASSYETEFDQMSGIWNMFNTNEDLVCTTPNYDAYRQQSPHWLDRETVSWEIFDKSRFKCVNWMQSNEEQV